MKFTCTSVSHVNKVKRKKISLCSRVLKHLNQRVQQYSSTSCFKPVTIFVYFQVLNEKQKSCSRHRWEKPECRALRGQWSTQTRGRWGRCQVKNRNTVVRIILLCRVGLVIFPLTSSAPFQSRRWSLRSYPSAQPGSSAGSHPAWEKYNPVRKNHASCLVDTRAKQCLHHLSHTSPT